MLSMALLYRVALVWMLALTACLRSVAAEPAAHLLTGTWRLVPERSTDLSPWKSFDLDITANDANITLTRHLASGRRTFDDVTSLDLTQSVNVVPVPMWSDNRHLGAYIGGDKTKRVRAGLLDDGRILRTSADLVLDTQQGARAVNILTDYKVSANGARLTLIELRSTRNEPIVYVFTRITAAEAAHRTTGGAE